MDYYNDEVDRLDYLYRCVGNEEEKMEQAQSDIRDLQETIQTMQEDINNLKNIFKTMIGSAITLTLTESGLSIKKEIDPIIEKTPKESRMDIYKREMLETMSKNNNQITPNLFSAWFCVDINIINKVLRELIKEGKIIKEGRGENTVWKIV